MSTWMANSASYWFRANFNFVIDGYEDTTAWGTATFFFEEVETTVGKKKFAVAKKKVAVAKKNFTPLLHKGVKSFFGAQRNAFSLTSSTLKVSKNAERCGTKYFLISVDWK